MPVVCRFGYFGASDHLHNAAVENFAAVFGRVEKTDSIIEEMGAHLRR